METIRLKHFKAIVDSGGLMKASEILGISGGGLSKSIKALEDELGQRLFMQKGRGLELTEWGKEFYEKLPAALKVLDELIHFQQGRSLTKLRPVSFASFEVFTTYFLSHFIKEYLAGQMVEIREAVPGMMERLIAEGICDIGITYGPIPYKGVEFLKAGRIKMGVFGTMGTTGARDVSLQELPFVVPIHPLEGSPSGVKGLDGWPEHLHARNAIYKVEMMETALQMASMGIAVAFLPKFVAEFFNHQVIPSRRLEEIKISHMGSIHRDVFIIQRKNREETPLIKKLARSIRNLGQIGLSK